MASRADEQHRRAQLRLADATSLALANLIAALPDVESQEAMELYSPQATRIVSGGQQRSALFSLAYMARLSPPSRTKTLATTGRALDGILVGAESPVARSPMLRLWARLGEGAPELEARQEAASYARGLATGDLQAAERGGLQEGGRTGSRPLRGWRKELSANACPWCVMIASGGGRYRRPDTVPFHPRDHCSVAPVFEDEREA